MVYCKIPKIIKPQSLYFSKALFEGLIFGGAYIWRGLLIGLASRGKEIYNFFFVLLCIIGQIPSTSLSGGGGIFGGAI